MRRLEAPAQPAALFAGWEETIIRSCLSGMMGAVYAADDLSAAVCVLGDFAFFAGRPDAGLLQVPGLLHAGMLLIPQTDDWMTLLQTQLGRRAHLHERYATDKHRDRFDLPTLRRLAQPPMGCTLLPIDGVMHARLRGAAWSRDLAANYPDAAAYARLARGFVLLRGQEIVAGASAYSSYPGGIEIEIDVREDMRRRGYATVVGAALVLDCLAHGLYPSWDAHTRISLALAEKLGYVFSHAYPCLEIE